MQFTDVSANCLDLLRRRDGQWGSEEWSEVKAERAVNHCCSSKDNGGFYCVHLTDKEIVVLRIYIIVTASLAFETVLGSQLIIFCMK